MLVRVREYKVTKKKIDSETDGVYLGCTRADINDGDGVAKKKSCGVLDLKYNGENCTRYIVRFKRYLKDVFPVHEHRMQELAANNHCLNGRVFQLHDQQRELFCALWLVRTKHLPYVWSWKSVRY